MSRERGYVSVARRHHVEIITLDRPDALNAISNAVADKLAEAFRDVATDDDAWVVVLEAAGEKAFCVGADLKERGSFSMSDFYENRKKIRALFQALRAVPQPVVAAPFGFALGGGFELVLSCDLVVAAEGTVMGLPEARVGLLPAGGGTQLLTRKIGPARAKEMIFTGRRVPAEEWARLGVVSEIVSNGDLEDAAMELAQEVARSSPVAVRHAKKAIDAALGVPLAQGIEIENEAWSNVITSEDRAEGIAAFNEKREPRWRNA